MTSKPAHLHPCHQGKLYCVAPEKGEARSAEWFWWQPRPDICITFGANIGLRHQQRPQLQKNHRLGHGHRRQHGPRCHFGLKWQCQPLRWGSTPNHILHPIHPTPLHHSPKTSTWSQAASQATDMCMAFGGNSGHGPQHKQRDHPPKHGPWQDSGLECHLGLRLSTGISNSTFLCSVWTPWVYFLTHLSTMHTLFLISPSHSHPSYWW